MNAVLFSNKHYYHIIAYAYFLIFLILSAWVLPLTDEPDYRVQLERVTASDNYLYGVYSPSWFFNILEFPQGCSYESNSSALFSKISLECLSEKGALVLAKAQHSIIFSLPLLLVVLFFSSSDKCASFLLRIRGVDLQKRSLALSFSLMIPSVFYFFGTVSLEVPVYFLSFLAFYFWYNIGVVGVVGFLLINYDHGAFLVFSCFLATYWFLVTLNRYFRMRWCVYYIFFSSVGVLIFGDDVLHILAELNLQSKFSEVQDAVMKKNWEGSYHILFYPVVTYVSTIFMTGGGIKSITTLVFYSVMLIFFTRRLIGSDCSLSDSFIGVLAAISTILVIVFMAPTHAYGKYYIFMIPFFIYFLLDYYQPRTLFAVLQIGLLAFLFDLVVAVLLGVASSSVSLL